MKDRIHGLPQWVHVALHWFCCTISMMGTPWHYSVVPIGCSLAHTTWTSLWLLVALAYGRLWGAPMHPNPSIHLGLEPHGRKTFPMAVSAGWFWKAHSAGLVLRLHTKH
jgi:hypothetical protein